jgi:hypothetical protein
MQTHTVESLKALLIQHDDGVLKAGDGSGKQGHYCAMNLAALAAGEPFSDQPTCVHPALRRLCIRLNDGRWASDQERTDTLLPLVAACMGTADLNITGPKLSEMVIRTMLPIAFEAAASVNPKHADKLRAAGERCRKEGTLESARDAAAYAAADAAAAYAYADAYADAYAAYAAKRRLEVKQELVAAAIALIEAARREHA